MKVPNKLSKMLSTAGEKAAYDNACKKLLSNKIILAWIMKSCLQEYRECAIQEIAENAFHAEDTCVPMSKQFNMMEIILYLYEKCRSLVNQGMPVSVLKEDNIFERVIAIKYDVPNNKPEMFDQYKADIDRFYDNVLERNG